MKIYIISDTHFYHDNIIGFCNRPADHNELLIDNLSRTIGREDVLYHLGDVIFRTPEAEAKLKSILSLIPGRVYLIRGNHDKWTDTKYLICGFAGVFDSIGIGDILLTHEPTFIAGGVYKLNIHGHLHNLGYSSKRTKGEEFDAFGGTYDCFNDGKHILYSPELENYKPIELSRIAARARDGEEE